MEEFKCTTCSKKIVYICFTLINMILLCALQHLLLQHNCLHLQVICLWTNVVDQIHLLLQMSSNVEGFCIISQGWRDGDVISVVATQQTMTTRGRGCIFTRSWPEDVVRQTGIVSCRSLWIQRSTNFRPFQPLEMVGARGLVDGIEGYTWYSGHCHSI